MSDEEYNLEESIKKFGILVPVIKDKEGNVIDGLHRLEIDPNAPVWTVDVNDAKQRAMVRLVINLDRRKLSSQEKTMLLGEIAEATKWNSQQIADALGKSQNWVLKYLPEQFKDKEKADAGKLGAESRAEAYRESQDFATRRVAETPTYSAKPTPNHIVECERCHTGTSEGIVWHGHNLCPKHYAAAQINPVGYDGYFRALEKGKQIEAARKTEPIKPKSIETWEHRKAQMSPQHSKMEELLLQKLNDQNVRPVITDRSFCLLSTVPDFYFPSKDLAVYVDGEVHQGKEDRDTELREMLAKRHGVRVVTLAYKGHSDGEVDRLLEEIVKEASA